MHQSHYPEAGSDLPGVLRDLGASVALALAAGIAVAAAFGMHAGAETGAATLVAGLFASPLRSDPARPRRPWPLSRRVRG